MVKRNDHQGKGSSQVEGNEMVRTEKIGFEEKNVFLLIEYSVKRSRLYPLSPFLIFFSFPFDFFNFTFPYFYSSFLFLTDPVQNFITKNHHQAYIPLYHTWCNRHINKVSNEFSTSFLSSLLPFIPCV